MRAVVVVIALAGCGRIGFDGLVSSTGDGGSGNGDGRLSDGGAALWPNKPPSCATANENNLSFIPPFGWTLQGAVTNVVDPTAPSKAPSVAQFRYPIGFVGGSAPGDLHFAPMSPGLREIYVGVVYKVQDPWDGHATTFQSLFYIDLDNGTTVFPGTYDIRGSGPPYHLGASYNNTVFAPTAADPELTLDTWHLAEVHWVMDQGVLEWWHDGELVGRYTTLVFADAEIAEVALAPIWGGTGDSKTQEDRLFMDQVNVCVR